MIKKLIILLVLCNAVPVMALMEKSGEAQNSEDVHWEEIELTFEGICICPKGWYTEEGEIWSYWEPFLAIDTVSEAYYSPYQGDYIGTSDLMELGGTNSSADAANVTNESTFSQAHAWLFTMMYYQPCEHRDYGMWISEYDSMWQNDELSAIITPESSLFASMAAVLLCETDAIAVNLSNHTLDFLPQCIGSSGMSYPMTGYTQNDNIIQANNLSASRMIYKLCRVFMICDPAENPCGCDYTPIWEKSHYKMHVVRPKDRSPAYPVGKSSTFYESGLNVSSSKGSNDEFLWIVYRKQLCCTCCEE